MKKIYSSHFKNWRCYPSDSQYSPIKHRLRAARLGCLANFQTALSKAVLIVLFCVSPVMADDPAPTESYIFNVSYADAQDAIGKALGEKLAVDEGGGQSVKAIINGQRTTPLYSSNKPIEVEVRGLRADNSINRWSANLVIIGDNKVISAMPLAGRYSIMKEVPVLIHQVRSGEIINDSDVEMRSYPQERTSSDTISDIADLVGRSPLRSVSPNRPIRISEISAPALIKKNSLVQMRYKTPSMEITTSGQAMEDGAKGDVIEVRNTASRKTTHAVVSDSDTVDVIASGMETSQIMPEGEHVYAK